MSMVLLVCILSCLGCQRFTGSSAGDMKIQLENIQLLQELPSGSGLAVIGDSVFIIGDDATRLYIYRIGDSSISNVPLLRHDTSVYRIAKPDKHDLEAITQVQLKQGLRLVAFGSGSLSPQRENLLVLDPLNPTDQQWIPAAKFYRQLLGLSAASELNIEGVVIDGKMVYLLNRSANEIFSFPLAELGQLFESNGDYQPKQILRKTVALPKGNGLQPRLSGGCLLSPGKLLFTAAMEDTPDAYNDGQVHGSYVGILDLENLRLLAFDQIETKDGKPIVEKLESIDLHGDGSKAIAISDNDQGSSGLFFFSLKNEVLR